MAWALDLEAIAPRVERFIYRLAGVNPDVEQRWTAYAISLLAFSLLSVLLLYALQRPQASLPLSLGFPGVKAGSGLQHRGLVRVQHELAVLCG